MALGIKLSASRLEVFSVSFSVSEVFLGSDGGDGWMVHRTLQGFRGESENFLLLGSTLARIPSRDPKLLPLSAALCLCECDQINFSILYSNSPSSNGGPKHCP